MQSMCQFNIKPIPQFIPHNVREEFINEGSFTILTIDRGDMCMTRMYDFHEGIDEEVRNELIKDIESNYIIGEVLEDYPRTPTIECIVRVMGSTFGYDESNSRWEFNDLQDIATRLTKLYGMFFMVAQKGKNYAIESRIHTNPKELDNVLPRLIKIQESINDMEESLRNYHKTK